MAAAVALFALCLAPASGETIYAIKGDTIIRVDSATPATVQATVSLTGLQASESLLAIDFRPANGQLYGLGSTSRLYMINLSTSTATQIGSGAFSPALSGASFGFAFNPVVDRIRVVSDTGQNLRLNPDTGAITAVDTALNGATTGAVGAAYTNSYAGATSTTLYVLSAATDTLYLQGSPGGTPVSPNGGSTTAIGPLGVDVSSLVGFDIAPSGKAFASLEVGGVSGLATIDLGSGAAGLIGPFPLTAPAVTGIAVGPIPPNCSFDVDGNLSIDPLTDGLLILRAMFGMTGVPVTTSALGPNATRTTWDQLRVFMNANCGTSFGP